MAVTFKSGADYGFKIMELFGVNAQMVVSAKKAGITVDQTYPGSFQIVHGGMVFGTVVIKGQAISLVKSGSLGPSSKQAVATQFEQALKKAFGEIGTPLVESGATPASMKSSTKSSSPAKSGLVVTKGASPSAFYLNQKIAGTSNGSVYTVMALISGGLVLSVRVKNGMLSVRAVFQNAKEGVAKFGSVLTLLGFTQKISGTASYMSAHYSCGDYALMVKTMGAIIGTLGFDKVEGLSTFSEVLNETV